MRLGRVGRFETVEPWFGGMAVGKHVLYEWKKTQNGLSALLWRKMDVLDIWETEAYGR